jgi:asparagine synthase (glutamine-hydrolysing)
LGVGDVRLDNPQETAARLSVPSGPITDLELALRAAAAAGADSTEELLGDFAFVTWDLARLRLVAVRDAFGVKPLFYSRLAPDLLAFSSHASLLGVGGAISEEYVAKYFVRSISDEDTIFDSVEVVPAAHVTSVTDGRWSVRRYWCADRFDVDPSRAGENAIGELRSLFGEAVRLRLAGRESVWSELSGGLDTSSIVSTSSWLQDSGAAAAGISGTITYADSLGSGDESEFVNAVVQATGVRNEQVRDSWPWRADGRGPMCTEQPGPATLFWFRDRKRNNILGDAGARVLLSGLGGDHILDGNLRFFADRLASGSIRRTAREMANWAAWHQSSFWRLAFRNALLPLFPAGESRLVSREGHVRIPFWVARNFRRRSGMDSHLRRTSTPRLPQGSLPRFRSSNIEQLRFLPCTVPRDNPFTLYERRFPFLYRPLVELTLRLPPELKVHPCARKIALREAMKGVLPEVVRTRLGKGGVNTRMLWALNHEAPLIERMLRDPILAQMGFVDAAGLRSAYAGTRTGMQQLTVPLFNTLALETWMLIETGRWSRLEGAHPVT